MPDETKKSPPELPQPAPKAYTTPKDGIVEAYTNYISINWGPVDVRIRFGQIIPISGEAEAENQAPERVVEERVAVTMSWVQAKLLRDQLNNAVLRYEKRNPELKIPLLPI